MLVVSIPSTVWDTLIGGEEAGERERPNLLISGPDTAKDGDSGKIILRPSPTHPDFIQAQDVPLPPSHVAPPGLST